MKRTARETVIMSLFLSLLAAQHTFVGAPSHRSLRAPRSEGVHALDASDVVPYVVGGLSLGFAAFVVTSGNEEDEDNYDRTRASKQVVQPQTSPALSSNSAEGELLRPLITTDDFSPAWRDVVLHLGVRAAAADAPAADGASLQSRIAAVKALARHRRTLAECLGLGVERCLAEQSLELLADESAIGPGATLPPSAVTLVRASQQFPGQSARQVRAFVLESAPSNDPSVNGRFDRLQAARLYAGCVQFGYFVERERDSNPCPSPHASHPTA